MTDLNKTLAYQMRLKNNIQLDWCPDGSKNKVWDECVKWTCYSSVSPPPPVTTVNKAWPTSMCVTVLHSFTVCSGQRRLPGSRALKPMRDTVRGDFTLFTGLAHLLSPLLLASSFSCKIIHIYNLGNSAPLYFSCFNIPILIWRIFLGISDMLSFGLLLKNKWHFWLAPWKQRCNWVPNVQ